MTYQGATCKAVSIHFGRTIRKTSTLVFHGCVLGAGENFNILEYTDSEIDSSATEHQEKSSGDQHSVAHQSAMHVPVSGALSVQDPSSSSPSSSFTESSLSASSQVTGVSMSCASVMSSASVSVTAVFPETVSFSASLLSSKPSGTCEASVAKCSVTSEEATKSESSRTSDSSTKSVPTSGFMTTDFQAKFLEFSQRKATCVSVGQTAPIDDSESAGSTSCVKSKKADMLVAPSTLKKSSPVADELLDSGEVKSGECHSSSNESQPELPTTSLPMQVDGCRDSHSDDSDEESDVVSVGNMTISHENYNVDKEYMEFLNMEEPELVEIWQSSVGLQVDGAADDETDDAEESQQKSSTHSDMQMVADHQHQLPDGSEGVPAAAATDAGMGTTLAPVEVTVPSCSSEVANSSCCVSDSVLASVTASESTMPVVSKPVDEHLPTDTASATNLDLIKDPESVIATSQLPKSVGVPSCSELQPTISKTFNTAGDITASTQCLKSETAQALEYSIAGEGTSVTTAVTASSGTSLASELQSSSSSSYGGAPLASAATSTSLEPMSENPGSGNAMSSRQVINQSLTTATEASASSLPSASVSSENCAVKASVASCTEAMTVQSGVLSQCPVVLSTLSSDSAAVNTSSQVVESYSVAASAVAVDSTAVMSAPGTSFPIASATVVVPITSHVDSGNNVATTNQAFNSNFPLRPEMQHAPLQPFMGHPPRRMYLPPDFHMQQRMMQHSMPASEGMMIPAEQLPHGPPPPYPNKQFAGSQTFWVRQQHPSGMPPEWIRHPADFGSRPLPPNLGSREWSRPQMMPSEWSTRQRMQQEWVYFPQQPHHPSQSPHQWVRTPYSNMPGFQLGSADAAAMSADAYNSGYQLAARNAASSAAVTQDAQVAQSIKSPGSATPRPSSHHSASPVPASPASARADIASPQSRSHTPRSMSRSSTPLAPMSGTPGMSHTPDHAVLPVASAASPHPSATTPLATAPAVPSASPGEQMAVPSSSCQAADHVGSLSSEISRPASASSSGPVSAAELGTSQPQLAAVSGTVADNPTVSLSSPQLVAFSHVSAENMMYIHRPPHGMPMSPEMRRMGPPAGGRYIAPPPHGMYMSSHPVPGTSGMTFYRMPSSVATTHSAIGALLNQQRTPVHYPAVTQPPGAPVMDSCYQLIHTQDAYLPHSQRHTYSSAVTVAGPSASVSGSFVLQHQHRGSAPVPSAEPASHQDIPNQASVLPNSMQTLPMLRGPFRMPQQLGPGSMPLGMRLGGSAPPVVYGPQRPVPPSKVRMIATPEIRPQMIQIPRSSVAEFAGPVYRPRPPGEQPLLLEDLLEQVCDIQ